ncbi:YkgJ family cysteine cluster protein [Alienimonas chondri]|uniref:YkgJ family cysteine cluster protein n=1 Tax=Alienimonas chondri TaxID=2681879 RepID=UPI001489581E|nr:YkgJ family cysteine cluster protein [Alienimonas chondri]
MAVPVQLPTIQRWTCQSCAGCCREHQIEITAEERDRLVGQGWTAENTPGGVEPIVPLGASARFIASKWLPPAFKRRARFRLNHAPDGACAFLRPDGLCAVHKEFGEETKPLACRVYPYALHPSRKGVTVSLRFSCPTVTANDGAAVVDNAAEVKALAHAVLPPGFQGAEPPALSRSQSVGWADFDRVREALAACFEGDGPFVPALLRAVSLAAVVDRSQFGEVSGRRLKEFLELISGAAAAELPEDLHEYDPPTRAGELTFRGALATYAHKDTAATTGATAGGGAFGNLGGRLRRVAGAAKFVSAAGLTPKGLWAGPIPAARLAEDAGPPPPGADELFARYMRVKLEGLACCGPAFDGWPLTDGFFALGLTFPLAITLARWRALAEQRDRATLQDVRLGLQLVDHHHGYDPNTTGSNHRRAVRQLQKTGDLAKLIARCGR